MTFEEYLITKKIDQKTFQLAEPGLYKSWKQEFEQINPNSFTAQKLYLINPIRRKYLLKQEEIEENQNKEGGQEISTVKVAEIKSSATAPIDSSMDEKTNPPEIKPATSSAKPARPVFKPKPKIN